ncbi:hypothetical protein [Paraburkholderia sartisoli]|uniref:hypothetical protein n=1 Tax=Paraburkholderia sartisoli TaxID=83784 RepID=UPI000B85F317|nr:hypothetical protein [Paraburkholderia sartisoli]
MHPHHGLQHQKLVAAPLVVCTAGDERADRQEVAIFLEDFLFRDPAEVLLELQKGKADSKGAMTDQKSGEQPHSMGGMSGMAGMSSMGGSSMTDRMTGMKMDRSPAQTCFPFARVELTSRGKPGLHASVSPPHTRNALSINGCAVGAQAAARAMPARLLERIF